MIEKMLISTLLCAATVAAGVALMYAILAVSTRRYNAAIATDILDHWQSHLQVLDPQGREQARLAPPVSVLAALEMLPSRRSAGAFRR